MITIISHDNQTVTIKWTTGEDYKYLQLLEKLIQQRNKDKKGKIPWQNIFTTIPQKHSNPNQHIYTKDKTDGTKSEKESEAYSYTGEATPHSKKHNYTSHIILEKTGKSTLPISFENLSLKHTIQT